MSDKTESTTAPPAGAHVIKAKFIENMDEFIKESGSVEAAMGQLQTSYRELKYLEASLQQRKNSLAVKVPEIENTLSALIHLRKESSDPEAAEETLVNYELADGIQATAKVKTPCEKVYLWLGANVMMEYPAGEAEELLRGNIDGAKKTIEQCEKDIESIKGHIVTMEVNIARLYNHDVKMRKLQKK